MKGPKSLTMPHIGNVFQQNGTIFDQIQDILKTKVLTKCYEDWTINFTYFRIHVCQPTETIFKLFHEDWTLNVASRVLTRKNSKAPPPGGHFHKDRKINVDYRVLTMKNAPPNVSYVFQETGTIFELVQDIIGTNLLTKFYEDRTINVASKVLTRKKAPPPVGHVFHETETIFELVQDIIGMNLLTKFHKDRTTNVASKGLTRKNAPPPGGHVFQPTGIIFEQVQYIIGMNLLTKNHEDWTITKNASPLGGHTINVTSRVLTRQMLTPHDGQKSITKAHHEHNKNCHSPVTIVELSRATIRTNLRTKFHEDWIINVTSRVNIALSPGSHLFQLTKIIFKLSLTIIRTNVLTKFHEDLTIHVTPRVLTRFYHSHTRKTAPPPGGHVFQRTGTI
ncbi:hypothetical protein DPMN_071651 [Dreissena polymorpha]|uniref:Uncharacterized protein n=1 Tax=Dreissena polymorpha TaxID=45954 RepID=A0A9D3Z332_DREPO|nr:hypothetical protein DPMN_071651 [Dreissena polymorpha]